MEKILIMNLDIEEVRILGALYAKVWVEINDGLILWLL